MVTGLGVTSWQLLEARESLGTADQQIAQCREDLQHENQQVDELTADLDELTETIAIERAAFAAAELEAERQARQREREIGSRAPGPGADLRRQPRLRRLGPGAGLPGHRRAHDRAPPGPDSALGGRQ